MTRRNPSVDVRPFDATSHMLEGSNPSIFRKINDPELVNYLVIDKYLSPAHGKGQSFSIPGKVRATYNSDSSDSLFLVAGRTFGRIDEVGVFTTIGTLTGDTSCTEISQNRNNQLLITDCQNAYVYNITSNSLTKINSLSNNFDIEDPRGVIINDLIFFVTGSNIFQPSEPNNALTFDEDDEYTLQSGEQEIQSIAIINKVIFIISSFSIDRWVINQNIASNPAASLLIRDNVFVIFEGLKERLSFVNKLNMFVGIFSSRDGGESIMMMDESSRLVTLTPPGLIVKMLSFGAVDSADIYKIDSIIYYEIVFSKLVNGKNSYRSFIYNFSNKTWSESTSPFQKVALINGVPFGFFGSEAFLITKYKNDSVKRCKTSIISLKGGSDGINSVMITARFESSSDAEVIKIGGNINGITNLIPNEFMPSREQYIQEFEYKPQVDGISYACEFSTISNAKMQYLVYKVM